MKIALAQLNPTVGDIPGNLNRVLDALKNAQKAHADLIITPELALTGYPPRDLLDYTRFVDDNLDALQALLPHVTNTALLVGFVDRRDNALFNAAALIAHGNIISTHHKTLLPTYDVFDEHRYFTPASSRQLATFAGEALAVTICEDIWNDPELTPRSRYDLDPVAQLVKQGASIIINLSASPYQTGKVAFRADMLAGIARKHARPLVYVNQVGGNDELIFDGNSMIFDPTGRLVTLCTPFHEDLRIIDLDTINDLETRQPSDDIDDLYHALALGTRDYVTKSGFNDVVLGLSGGIDSALVACIAVEALGPDHVRALSMPGPFSSPHSIADAKTLAANLGIRLDLVDINPVYQAYLDTLQPLFENRPHDVTEENIQARIRGNTLMSLSNKLNCLVLATGNKSELAVGYCTLYGDMAGSLAVISDLPKTQVYALARHINTINPVIPSSTLTKPPSAELRPDQTDQDTLPPYDILDAILHQHIEEHHNITDLAHAGTDPAVTCDVIRRIASSEYKRRQAPPGLKVTGKAFGTGRRMPLVQRWI